MKVLVTGAAGVLGRAVTALLEDEPGVELRLTDVLPLATRVEFVQADLSKPDDARPLCEGIDQVIHPAAIHPWKEYTSEQYIDCNIKATCNVLESAAASSVRRVIYTSSIAAMGMDPNGSIPLPWDETKPSVPDSNIYAITKHVGEQFCELFRQQRGSSYIALRPGTFIPRAEDDPQFGLSLLSSWLHASDVAAAHVLALKSDVESEAIVIAAKVPFGREDAAELLTDAPSVITKYYPRAKELPQRGIALPESITRCYCIEKAQRLLGYEPQYTFDRWLAAFLDQPRA